MYARALRPSPNRKENSVERAGSIIIPQPSKVETAREIILSLPASLLIPAPRGLSQIITKSDLSRFCVRLCIEERAPVFSLLGMPSKEPPLLLRCNSGDAPR